MKWKHVEENWSAFYEAIEEKWPDVAQEDLDAIDGDQKRFVEYLIEQTGQDAEDITEELREWLAGELPSDVVMDPTHDNRSLNNVGKYVNEGEDVYDADENFADEEDDE